MNLREAGNVAANPRIYVKTFHGLLDQSLLHQPLGSCYVARIVQRGLLHVLLVQIVQTSASFPLQIEELVLERLLLSGSSSIHFDLV